ncbi:MAG: WecB/TagA/CpsF family glycosyltransferase [Elainella sp. Prado103]|jgi:UDP-N-acetyl-D-mannosaminuronic acid transferase (WecB/TagA/CpsF family)|nr:WecB/TagA/CpsF family glycosyltransferase [Elainella sp. Prado103]
MKSRFETCVIPQWVSDMGLEWLYVLLAKSNSTLKTATR